MIRKFKTEKGKTIYAVTELHARSHREAIEIATKEVARYKKEPLSTKYHYQTSNIRRYTKDLDGLYFGIGGGKACIAVWKGEL